MLVDARILPQKDKTFKDGHHGKYARLCLSGQRRRAGSCRYSSAARLWCGQPPPFRGAAAFGRY